MVLSMLKNLQYVQVTYFYSVEETLCIASPLLLAIVLGYWWYLPITLSQEFRYLNPRE